MQRIQQENAKLNDEQIPLIAAGIKEAMEKCPMEKKNCNQLELPISIKIKQVKWVNHWRRNHKAGGIKKLGRPLNKRMPSREHREAKGAQLSEGKICQNGNLINESKSKCIPGYCSPLFVSFTLTPIHSSPNWPLQQVFFRSFKLPEINCKQADQDKSFEDRTFRFSVFQAVVKEPA